MSWFIFIVYLASVPLSAEMARERGRSQRFWYGLAVVVGPFAPLALLLLGDSRQSVPAH